MAPALFWVNKTASSASLSHSEDAERLEVLSQAQRSSRQQRGKKAGQEDRSTRRKKRINARYDKEGNPVLQDNQMTERTISCQTNGLLERQKSRNTIAPIICTDQDWTCEERLSVDFFLHATVFKVITLNRDAVFWRETVPQLTRQHPAFRHLVVAISSTHQLLFDADPEKLNVFAMKQILLRCDLVSADRSIESGLRMANGSGSAFHEELKRMLFMVGRNNGYKLWAPDINYQFEKSNITSEAFSVWEGSIIGPFVDTGQVLMAYRNLTVEVVTKVMRNLARGAHIDPDCTMAVETHRQLGLFSFYLEHYSAHVPPDDTDTRLELAQLQAGFYVTCLLFYTKIISPNEQTYEAYIDICQKFVELADEVVTACHAGQEVKYIDKIVNLALLSFGFGCRDSVLRRRAIALLQSQWKREDGLVHYLRGVVLYMMDVVEERELGLEGSDSSHIRRRPTLAGLRCVEKDEKALICLDWTTAFSGEIWEEWFDWSPSFDAKVSAQDINSCLQGIMAGY